MVDFIPREIQRVHPTRMVFGEGVARQVGEAAREFGRVPLLVIGGGAARRTGSLDLVEASLKAAGLNWKVHEGVHTDPTLEDVVGIVWAIRDGLHDTVIALGGGSVIDAAKIAARDVQNRPLIAIPTTSGTGSEVTRYSFLVDTERGRKFPTTDMQLLPRVALIDPELTYSCPPKLTAATGLDAISHHIEGYFNQRDRQAVNPLAIEGLPIAMRHLKSAVDNGVDIEARREMAKSSLMAGVVIHFKPTGLPHGFSYCMYEQATHGAAVSVLLPYCWAYYAPVMGDKSLHIAEALGVNVAGLSNDEAARRGIEVIFDLYRSLGQPVKLDGMEGMTWEVVERSAIELAKDTGKLDASPRRPESGHERDDMLAIARAAWHGIIEEVPSPLGR